MNPSEFAAAKSIEVAPTLSKLGCSSEVLLVEVTEGALVEDG